MASASAFADMIHILSRNLSSRLPVFVVLALGLAFLDGCSKNASSLTKRHARLFQAAEPQVKELWQTVDLAMQTNGFFAASVALQKLHQVKLTPEQLRAVNDTALAVSDQMYDAANKGDARATEAINELRKLTAR